MLPVIWEPAGSRLVMHMAKANQHWKAIEPDTPALAVVTGPEAYVSPAWYATKAEHGKVVPTWNYSAVHFTGRVTVNHDADWLLEAVSWLTDLHEARREPPASRRGRWTTPPRSTWPASCGRSSASSWWSRRSRRRPSYSQNRSDADRAGVVAGLRAEGGRRGEAQVADRMADDLGL